MPRRRTDYDSPWKEIIERYFPDFMAFFFPNIHAEINWNKGYEFLDKELQKVVRRAKTGRGYVDKLVKVWRMDGTEEWLLIHIEIQSQVEAGFTERMYVYNYRIFDRYKQKVISLALLADQDTTWRPQTYGYSLWGYKVSIEFPIIKLLDYAEQWTMLESSKNPFAVVIMAHLKAQETRRYPKSRLRWKIEIVRGLYARGWSHNDIWELFRFLDWMMELPERFELQFEKALKELEEAQKMRYVTQIERRAKAEGIKEGIKEGVKEGVKEGIEQGSLQAIREGIIEVLTLRFGSVPQALITLLNQETDLQQLKIRHRQAVLASSLDEFENLAATITVNPQPPANRQN